MTEARLPSEKTSKTADGKLDKVPVACGQS